MWTATVPVRSVAGRAADWWSAGIVMYKLMTGRVPFRGKTKQLLRERIITAPLKWPRAEDHPHSATAPGKDMTYRMLKKNPVERLGSRNYSDLKTHPFFDQFDWRMLYNRTDLCDIPSIAEIMKADALKGNTGPDPEDKRRHLTIDEMTDVGFEAQKPLLCYASGSFKKLMNTVRDSKAAVQVSGSFMETSGMTTTPIDYRAITPGQSSTKTGMASIANDGKENASPGTEKVDLILFRKRKFYKYWSFGFSMRRAKGEQENKYYLYVDLAEVTPVNNVWVYPGDVVTQIDGVNLEGLTLDQVTQILNNATSDITLSVVPLSPMRVRRIPISKLHETAMTDTNLATRTTAAEIESQ